MKIMFQIKIKKHKILLLSLLLFTLYSFGQSDTSNIRNEIINYKDSDSQIIEKGRRLLVEKLMKGDIRKAKEIKDYLINGANNQPFEMFSPYDYWLILFWTQEYEDLLLSLKSYSAISFPYHTSCRFPKDLVFDPIWEKSKDSLQLLDSNVKNSMLQEIDKDFLSMVLQHIFNHPYISTKQDTLNVIADSFLTSHPKSFYEDYTRKYIRYKYVPSKWGLGVEFFSGYGLFTAELKNYYKNIVPIGIGIDIYYKKFSLYLRDYIGFSKTKIDIPYSSGIWKKESSVTIFLPEASLGFVISDNKLLKVVPFTGIASTDISPPQHDLNQEQDMEQVELKFTTTYAIGLDIDIKLGSSRISSAKQGVRQDYTFLRLRYAYMMPQFENKYAGMSGNIHSITIGIGGFQRNIIREY